MRVDSRLELVVQLDIAKRLGITKQRVAQLAARDDFPTPIGVLGRSTVWRWSDIERWARETGRLTRPAQRQGEENVGA